MVGQGFGQKLFVAGRRIVLDRGGYGGEDRVEQLPRVTGQIGSHTRSPFPVDGTSGFGSGAWGKGRPAVRAHNLSDTECVF